jgi:hypothetical protein
MKSFVKHPGFVLLACLVAVGLGQPLAQQPNPQTPTKNQPSIYIVDGLPLGGQVVFGSEAYRSYHCVPSEQFKGFTWCQKKVDERVKRGQFTSSYSILHSQDGTAFYVNRYLEPAWFSGNEANNDINSRSKKFGAPARIIPMPQQSSVPNGMIVTWGNVTLEPLDSNNVKELASGHDVHLGFTIDHIGNFQRSAQQGLPIYRLTGGAGYVWAASWNQNGIGTLRFLAIDTSAITSQTSGVSGKPESVTASSQNDPLREQTRTSETEGDARRLADETAKRIVAEAEAEAAKRIAEETAQQKIAEAEAAKRSAATASDEVVRYKKQLDEQQTRQSYILVSLAGGLLTVIGIFFLFRKKTSKPISLKSNKASNSDEPKSDITDQLSKLAKLHADGVLSDDDFSTLKAKLIYGHDQTSEQPSPAAYDLLRQSNTRRSNWTVIGSAIGLIVVISGLLFLFNSEEYSVALFRANLEGTLRRNWAALFDVGRERTTATEAELRVSVTPGALGSVLEISNGGRSAVEIRDVVINDRAECTFDDLPDKATLDYNGKERWVMGEIWIPEGLSNEDKRQLWLHPKEAYKINSVPLTPNENGEYEACSIQCLSMKDLSSCRVEPKKVCTKVSLNKFEKIILNVGDVERWLVNPKCKQVIRAKVVTDVGSAEYQF